MNDNTAAGAFQVIASVAAAYAGRADTTADQILALVARLSAQLGAPGGPAQAPVGAAAVPAAPLAAPLAARSPLAGALPPALPVERAVTNDRVYCLCCGKGFKMLKRHLGSEHGLSEDDYRAQYGLPADLPLVAPSYSERKAAYARKVGLGKYSRAEASV